MGCLHRFSTHILPNDTPADLAFGTRHGGTGARSRRVPGDLLDPDLRAGHIFVAPRRAPDFYGAPARFMQGHQTQDRQRPRFLVPAILTTARVR